MTLIQPPLPPPTEASTQAVTAPIWETRTFWATLGGVLSTLGAGATGLGAVFETSPSLKAGLIIAAGVLAVLAGVCSNLGSLFARAGGVDSAARVLEKAQADHADLRLNPPGTR